MNEKASVARLSILSNISLIFIKIFAGIFSGSVSIIAEAIHSTMDLLASIIAFFSVKISDNPPDKEHPYGHGKFENLSGTIEALLIFIAAGWIIFEAVHKIINLKEVHSPGIGVIVMAISSIVNILVSMKLYKVAKKTGSLALEADALHLKVDVYTSAGVAIGLLIIWITKIPMLDPIVAIFVALVILKESVELLIKSFMPMLDVSFSQNEIENLKKIIDKFDLKYHKLRTRKAGNYRFIDLHLLFPGDPTLKNAHDISENLKASIRNDFPYTDVTIHLEPDE
jgi:cation diffusion facilitator family transporter